MTGSDSGARCNNQSASPFRERYPLLRVLKVGHGVETTLATDLKRGGQVVVKTIDSGQLPPETRVRLKREAEVLSRLGDLPQFAPPLEVGCEAGFQYVVMPYVPGVSLKERLAEGSLGLEDGLRVARSVLQALAALHGQGVLHRDVKPANVVLGPGPSVEQVTLTDFGFARCAYVGDEDPDGEAARYMAPELAGALNRPVDGRADLYSVGIVLFECLAGQPPYQAARLGDVLRQHLSVPPPALANLANLPTGLNAILQHLLEKDPDDRYQSAGGALADLDALSESLWSGQANPEIVVGAADVRRTLAKPAMIGRRSEYAALEDCLRQAGRGDGCLVVVTSESGGGKSRLLDEFVDRSVATGLWVGHGHGVCRSATQPLQVLAGAFADAAARRDLPVPGDGTDFDTGPRTRFAPEFTEALAAVADVPEAARVTRAAQALVGVLDGLGSLGRPALLVLDDCQWADELSLRVIREWAEQGDQSARPARHLLVVAALRSEALNDGHLLGSGCAARRIEIPPLDATQVRQMVTSMTGPVPAEVPDLAVRLAGGNPFLVDATVRGLVESEALVGTADGWQFDPPPAGPQASGQAGTVLVRRLQLLPSGTCRLLTAGAVLGRHFELVLAGNLVGQDEAEAAEALVPALQRHLLWRPATGRAAFVHDRIRDAFLANLDPPALAKLHRRAAAALEAGDPSRDAELAFHFDAAGEHERALPYALQAAEVARSAYDLESAEVYYRIAERGATGATGGAVAEELGLVLMSRGNYQDARRCLEQARESAEDPLVAARVEVELAELGFKCGELKAAADLLETALRRLGQRIPHGTAGLIAGVLRESLAGRVSVRWPARRRPERAVSETSQLLGRIYARLLYVWWFQRSSLASLWILLRERNLGVLTLSGSEQAHTQAIYGASLTALAPPLWQRGLRHTDGATVRHLEAHELWGRGQALSMRGMVLHAAGRYQEALEACTEATVALERAGDLWERNFAAWHRALCLNRLGRREEAEEAARELHSAGIGIGDRLAVSGALEAWAQAAQGRVPPELMERALCRASEDEERAGRDVQGRAALLMAEALRLRHAGKLDDALSCLTTARAMAREAGARHVYMAPLRSWEATVSREIAEQAVPGPARRRLLRRARHRARAAVRFARWYRTELPHAWREAAMVAALAGRSRVAQRRFERSAAAAAGQGAGGELAETRWLQNRAALLLGWPATTDDPGLDDDGAEPMPGNPSSAPSLTLGLADRFVTLLTVGRRLASAASSREIGAVISDAAVTLLRAEGCTVAGLGVAGDRDPAIAEANEPALRALAGLAIDAREPVVAREPITLWDDLGNGVVTAQLRSALCAPILMGNEVVGYFLAYHHQLSDLFGRQEEALAAFIAALAGAALERERLQQEMRVEVVSAQEAERARVARDLHDEIGQALTSVLLGLRLVEKAIEISPLEPARILERTQGLREVAGEALNAVQRLAFELRPTVLDDLGLVAALRRLTGDVSSHHHIMVDLEPGDLGPGERLPPALETTAYRVVQESLTNVVRHSQASTCSVMLAREAGTLRVVVEDDGVGFDPDQESSRRLGLRGMRERATLVDGTLRISSSPGKGTAVVLEVPVA